MTTIDEMTPSFKFSIAGPELRRAVSALELVIERRSTIPVLGAVLIEWTGAQLQFTGTDLDIQLTVACEAHSDAPAGYKFVALPKRLRAAASFAGAGMVEIVKYGERLTMTADGVVMSLLSQYPQEDFPLTSDLPGADHIPHSTLAAQQLHYMLRMTRHCISTEETRYYLNGAFVHQKTGTLRVVTTDGHRLGQADSDVKWPHEDAIWPKKTVDLLLTLIPEKTNMDLKFVGIGTKIKLTFGDYVIFSKAIDGTFPDYSRVTPAIEANPEFQATISVEQVRRASSISDERSRALRISPAKGFIICQSGDGDEIKVPLIGGVGEAGFNGNYLIAQGAVTPVMRMGAKDRGAPARITGEDPNCLWVLMPMRI